MITIDARTRWLSRSPLRSRVFASKLISPVHGSIPSFLNTSVFNFPFASDSALEIDLNDRKVDLRVGQGIGMLGESIQRNVGNDFQHETVIDPSFPNDREILV